MSAINDRYPVDCPFCKISSLYPPNTTTSSSSSPIPLRPDPTLISPQCHLLLSTPHVLAFLDIMPMAPGHILLTTRRHYTTLGDLHSTHPSSSHTTGISPSGGGLWTSPDALHSSRALGEWLPRLSRALCSVTGVQDWNVVQNNGHRAAQVVGHVHFHLIPRYQEGRDGREILVSTGSGKGGGGEGGTGGGKKIKAVAGRGKVLDLEQGRSWKMFGRGTREDLDDEEGRVLAARLREALRREIGEEPREEDDEEEEEGEVGKKDEEKAKL